MSFWQLGFPISFEVDEFWVFTLWVLSVIVHVTFAVAVYRDAKHIETLVFVKSGIWLIATLIGGVVTAAIYWALHHSRLNPSNRSTSTETDKEAIL